MKRMQIVGIALLLMTGIPVISMAQDKVEAVIGADFVSGYIWRGQDLGNVSIQPSASVSYLQRFLPFGLGLCRTGKRRHQGIRPYFGIQNSKIQRISY